MNIVKSVTLTFSCVLIFGCSDKQHSESNAFQRINIGPIVMTVPYSFKFTVGRGVDSYVAYLVDEKHDTFNIERGYPKIINNLFEIPNPVFPMEAKERFKKNIGRVPSSEEAFFSKDSERDSQEGIFERNYYMYDTINGIVVKIVQPKRLGNGMTGLFIPELSDSTAMSIYAKNLDSNTHILAMRMFRTIRYK